MSGVRKYLTINKGNGQTTTDFDSMEEAQADAEAEAADLRLGPDEFIEIYELIAIVRCKPVTTYTTVL